VRNISSIYRELRKGVLISAIGKYSNYIIQLGVTAILSRILTPDEFGIVAIVNVFLVFFNLLVDIGIGPAIIQNKQLTKQQTDSLFTFTIVLSLAVSSIFALLAKPISAFYGNPALIPVTVAMSFVIFSTGLTIVPQAILLKQKRFLDVNLTLIFSNLISGTAAVLLALNGFSYYSLIILSFLRNFVSFLLYVIKSGARPANLDRQPIREISGFSRNQFLFNFINYFSRNLDNLLIGKFLSAQALAYYDKAYQLSLYPNQIFTSVITPVIQPILSEYEQKKQVIKDTYLMISKILLLIGLPLTVFLFFSAREIIFILFGPQWENSILAFRLLALSVWIQMIQSSTGAIFQSANRTDLLLLSGVLSTILNVAGIVAGIWLGRIEYVAGALVISFFINFIQCNYLLMVHVFHSRQREYYQSFRSPLLISLFVGLPLLAFQPFSGKLNVLISFLGKGVISLALYLAGLKWTGNLDVILRALKIRKKG